MSRYECNVWLSWLCSMVGMVIDELPRCYSRKAARSIIREWSVCGVEKGYKFPGGNRSANGYGSMADHVFGSGLPAGIMSGVMTSMQARTRAGRSYRLLTILDEHSRECLAIVPGRRLTHADVLECLSGLFVHRGVPIHLRSDNGTEFTAQPGNLRYLTRSKSACGTLAK